jgi:hypothetical protein
VRISELWPNTKKVHQLSYEYTDKNISAWGGLRLVHELYCRSGLKEQISGLSFIKPESNRGYVPAQIIEGFLVSVILGSRRFTHSGMVRQDEVIKEIFGWNKGMASQSTFSRFFSRYDFDDNESLMTSLNKWWFERIQVDKHTLDFDSTVISRFGMQEGAERGYNPNRKGRASHNPILAFSAESRMVVQAWMRTGDSVSTTDFDEFLKSTLAVLPVEKIGLCRMDSGFCSGKVLLKMEDLNLKYIVSMKMRSRLVDTIYNQRTWRRMSAGIDCCSFEFKEGKWDKDRRVVVVRKDVRERPKSGGKTLFPD